MKSPDVPTGGVRSSIRTGVRDAVRSARQSSPSSIEAGRSLTSRDAALVEEVGRRLGDQSWGELHPSMERPTSHYVRPIIGVIKVDDDTAGLLSLGGRCRDSYSVITAKLDLNSILT
eukprot:TRINITY_DN3949_c0_g2_i1.p2 TRINITY_DN3949_c0_g2~~TRINITY_DN3949_c0_g2_i1.p2  ORF type:complete len:117 (-),score=9.79 TRINITY_DN3949_c0_g2_i1:117-467(-)